MMIDTHCHLYLDDKDYLDEVLDKMGNNIMIVSGANMKMNKDVIKLINSYDNIYGMIGFHPADLGDYNEENIKWLEENLKNQKIVALGEIGLDYYYGSDNKEEQKRAFIEQINIAKKVNKPIVIHMREATKDTLEIMKEHIGNLKSVIHCYSGSLESAKEFVELGSYLGIGGVVTFKNADKLKRVVKEIPLENLLLETDSPYLSPEPFRGAKNRPDNVKIIGAEIAKLKEIEVEKVFEITTQNAVRIFDLKVS